jgi:hypothetical protein
VADTSHLPLPADTTRQKQLEIPATTRPYLSPLPSLRRIRSEDTRDQFRLAQPLAKSPTRANSGDPSHRFQLARPPAVLHPGHYVSVAGIDQSQPVRSPALPPRPHEPEVAADRLQSGNTTPCLQLSRAPPPIQPKPSHLEIQSTRPAASQSVTHLLPFWLRRCQSLHGDACQSAYHHLNGEAPRFLIDLHNKGQIIPTQNHRRYNYVALSYHRQEANGVKLTENEKLELRHSKSLFQHPLLPAIVHQTMRLVRDIGEHYLWIDFLCLAHGDDNVVEEMQRMDKIYAGALFTVIAACDNGLYEQQAEPLTGNVLELLVKKSELGAMIDHYKILLGSVWATRGWTFQERMFSKRAIVFVPNVPSTRHEQQLPDGVPRGSFFWECECAMWDDSILSLSSAPIPEDGPSRLKDPKLYRPEAATEQRLHFARYLQTIYYYNSRIFGNPQDVLRAILGCLRTLAEDYSESFRSGFICGLPRRNFHESLLWQPLGTSAEETRRTCNCKNHKESPHQYLPSWSWCGWQCELDLQSFPADQRERLSNVERADSFAWEIKSTVQWKFKGEDGTREDMWLSTSLPQTSHRCDRPFITCQTHKAKLFIRKVIKLDPTLTGKRRAARKNLNVKVPIEKISSTQTRHVVTLEDSNGLWAGVLGLMTSDSIRNGQEAELVAISEGSVRFRELAKSWEESQDASTPERYADPDRNNPLKNAHCSDGFYRFYNVLWVEKRGDHFVRKALGRVEAKMWEKLCKSRTTEWIVLG